MPPQLQAYRTEPEAAPQSMPVPSSGVNPRPQSHAANILGLGAFRSARSAQRSLEAEVETYLNDVQECNSSITFWQA